MNAAWAYSENTIDISSDSRLHLDEINTVIWSEQNGIWKYHAVLIVQI